MDKFPASIQHCIYSIIDVYCSYLFNEITGSLCVCLYRRISLTTEPIWFFFTMLVSLVLGRFIIIKGRENRQCFKFPRGGASLWLMLFLNSLYGKVPKIVHLTCIIYYEYALPKKLLVSSHFYNYLENELSITLAYVIKKLGIQFSILPIIEFNFLND